MIRPFIATAMACAALALTPIAASAQMAAPSKDPAQAPAGNYVIDKRHTSVIIKLDHLGFSNYAMRFNGVEATYSYNPANPLATKITATVDPRSVDTGLPGFNEEIAGERMLNAAAHPTITFTSTGIRDVQANRGIVTGDLTFLGVTKPIDLHVVFNGGGPSMGGINRMGFSAQGKFKRSDYGLNFMRGMLGDEVEIHIETEFVSPPNQ